MIFTAMLVFSSCEKIPFDYRNKYLGRWIFKVEVKKVNVDYQGQFDIDTLSCIGVISYDDEDREKLLIDYCVWELKLRVGKNGELTESPNQYSSGSFEGEDHLHFYYWNGGLGGGWDLG